MDCYLCFCSVDYHKSVVLDVKFLLRASSVLLGFAFAVIECIFGSDICVQNDQIVQTTHRTFCSDNKKDFDSWTKFNIFQSLNQYWSSIFDCNSILCYGLRIFRFDPKAKITKLKSKKKLISV